MTSQLLLEGILDVKVPRGSEDRKLWKPWRRQWTRFSVIYPSGRREPVLFLEFGNRTSETPENQIQISRDGLKLFRCRSKSRPYRTWAIMSGNKPLLFFAAESEIRAQEWMQSVRDGLWPSCFSFQMLTACAYEVSLIDDENTFLSGLLGVYGRLVLTSKEVISLMHPHWGAILLQISLPNIKDVYLIREEEDSSAGVFMILIKGDDRSIRTLQFYSSTVKDVTEWILSKMLVKDHSTNCSGTKQTNSEANVAVKSLLDEDDSSLIKPSNKIDNISGDILVDLSSTNSTYENLQGWDLEEFYLPSKNTSKYSNSSIDKKNAMEEINKQVHCTEFLVSDSSANGITTLKEKWLIKHVAPNKEDILYENFGHENITSELETDTNTGNDTFMHFHTSNNVLERTQFSNDESGQKLLASSEVSRNETSRFSEYAVVNKTSDTRKMHKQKNEKQSSLTNSLDNQKESKRHILDNGTATEINIDRYKNISDIFYHHDMNSDYANTNSSNDQKTHVLTKNTTEYTVANRVGISESSNSQVLKSGSSDSNLKYDVAVNNKTDSLKNSHKSAEININLPTSNLKQEENLKNNSYQNIDCISAISLNDTSLKRNINSFSISSLENIIPHSIPCGSHSPINKSSTAVSKWSNEKPRHLQNIPSDYIDMTITSTRPNIVKSDNLLLETHTMSQINTSDPNRRNDLPRLLLNIPNHYSASNITSTRSNMAKSDSLISEEDTGVSKQQWKEDDQEFTQNVYEDLMDRRGTIYEEIDESDDEYVQHLPSPPLLPERPPNLEIPSSFRLYKLSHSITEILEEMKTTPSPSTNYSSGPKLIKKIKETSRIMHL